VVRADTRYATIADLKGKPVAFGAKGSGLTILARTVLDGIGLDGDRDFQAIYLDKAGDGPAMVLDGRAAALWGGPAGLAGLRRRRDAAAGSTLHRAGRRGNCAHSGEASFFEAHGDPGRKLFGSGRRAAVGGLMELCARAARPRGRYRLHDRALHTGEDVLAARLDQARETTAANTAAAAPNTALIHPGTLRYLRKIGLAR